MKMEEYFLSFLKYVYVRLRYFCFKWSNAVEIMVEMKSLVLLLCMKTVKADELDSGAT